VSTHHALNVLETELDKWIEYGQTLDLSTSSVRRLEECTATGEEGTADA